jgi:Uma2 family endonuclease
MTTQVIVCDPHMSERLIADRKARGHDCCDEVWDRVYVMPPMPNDEHQQIVARLVAILQDEIGWPGLGEVRPGVNVSDRVDGWQHNYRVPDVAVFLQECAAVNHGTHWVGGPDWAAEILSPGDRAREKLDFYAAVGVRELLIIDRDPWALELYRPQDGTMTLVGQSTAGRPDALASAVLPLSFRLTAGNIRPLAEVRRPADHRTWLV